MYSEQIVHLQMDFERQATKSQNLLSLFSPISFNIDIVLVLDMCLDDA